MRLDFLTVTKILFRESLSSVVKNWRIERGEKGSRTDKERKRSVAALIDFSCNLLTNSSPDISLSLSLFLSLSLSPSLTDSPSIKAQSGPGWAAVKRQTIYQPVSSCCLLFHPDRLRGCPRPNNSDWGDARIQSTHTVTHKVYVETLFKERQFWKGHGILHKN